MMSYIAHTQSLQVVTTIIADMIGNEKLNELDVVKDTVILNHYSRMTFWTNEQYYEIQAIEEKYTQAHNDLLKSYAELVEELQKEIAIRQGKLYKSLKEKDFKHEDPYFGKFYVEEYASKLAQVLDTTQLTSRKEYCEKIVTLNKVLSFLSRVTD